MRHKLYHAWRKTSALMSIWLGNASAYRVETIIWMFSGIIPLIMLAVWIGKAEASGGTVNDFSPADFSSYFLTTWLSSQMIVAWVSWELDYQIRQGILSPKLLRPIDVFWDHMASHLAERVIRLPIVIPVVIIGSLLVPGTKILVDWEHTLVYAVSISLGWLIRFQISYIIGICTFWFDRATALDDLYFVLAAFLAGSFAPIAFLPAPILSIINWLPFPYTLYYPVSILNASLNWPEIGEVLLVQVAWVLGLWFFRTWLWQQGLKRYGAVGA